MFSTSLHPEYPQAGHPGRHRKNLKRDDAAGHHPGGLTEAEIEGIKVAGKTGTAESGNGAPHSWWITFAPADDPEIAMCVMVENGGRADRGALPIAARLMQAYLEEGV